MIIISFERKLSNNESLVIDYTKLKKELKKIDELDFNNEFYTASNKLDEQIIPEERNLHGLLDKIDLEKRQEIEEKIEKMGEGDNEEDIVEEEVEELYPKRESKVDT